MAVTDGEQLLVAKDSLRRLRKMVKEAIMIDGDHHRLWYLCEMLEIVDPLAYRRYQDSGEDMGIAP